MKLAGCLLLLSGWMLAVTALLLLGGSGQRLLFVAAGVGVEVLGLASLAHGYSYKAALDLQEERNQP